MTAEHYSLFSYPFSLFLSFPILILDILLKFWVGPVEENLSALAGYKQALHICPQMHSCSGLLFTTTDAGCYKDKVESIEAHRFWGSGHLPTQEPNLYECI